MCHIIVLYVLMCHIIVSYDLMCHITVSYDLMCYIVCYITVQCSPYLLTREPDNELNQLLYIGPFPHPIISVCDPVRYIYCSSMVR